MNTHKTEKGTEIKSSNRTATVFKCGYLVFVVAAVIILLLVASKKIFPPEPIQPTEAQFIVVYPYLRGGKDPDIVAGVTLITDEEEIEAFNILAEQAKHGNHACGFDYGITFWVDEMAVEKEKHLNYNCDIIKPALKQYFLNSYSNPTHYAYYLDIPVNISPQDVIENFAAQGLLVTCYSGPYANLPSISFWKAYYLSDEEGSLDALQDQMSTEVRALVDKLALTYPIVDYSIETDRKANDIGATGNQHKAILYFELGTDLTSISQVIETAGFDSSEPKIPETYTIRLLVENPNPKEISSLIYENFNYVLEIRW